MGGFEAGAPVAAADAGQGAPVTGGDCRLCDEIAVPEDVYARLFDLYGAGAGRGLREGAAQEVAARSDLIGAVIEPRDVWRHFAHHDRRQPRPPAKLRHVTTVSRVLALSERQREVLLMVGRLGVSSAQQVWQTLYEDQLATVNAARAACYRELRPLIHGHMLYRAHPPRSAGLAMREEARLERLVFLHPGRVMIPWLEQTDGLSVSAVTDAREVDQHRLHEVHAASEVVLRLRRELYSDAPDVGSPADIRIAPANWFGRAQASMWFHHPGRGRTERVTPDGLAAVSVRVPRRGVDTLLPFFYLNDAGYLPLDTLVERLLLFGGLNLSGAASARFPALAGHVPPVVVVCDSARRTRALSDAIRLRGGSLSGPERPALIASDRTSSAGRAFTAKVWASLWDADDPELRVTLLKALLQASGAGAQAAGLRAGDRLSADMAAAARPPR